MPALRAYLVSHLGKYVPGKAMVVVVRAGMVVPFGARASTAAIATFYETLVMMAAGGLIAAAGFAMAAGPVGDRVAAINSRCRSGARSRFRSTGWPPGAGWGWGWRLSSWPCRRSSAGWRDWSACPIPGVGPEAMPRFTGRLLVQGLLWSSCGWILLGLSQLAVVRAFDPAGADAVDRSRPGARRDRQRGPGDRGRLRGGRAPGGLGVREGVLMSALAPAIGSDQAVIASLVLRLVWVAAELVAAAILVPWFRRPPADGKPPREAGPDRP